MRERGPWISRIVAFEYLGIATPGGLYHGRFAVFIFWFSIVFGLDVIVWHLFRFTDVNKDNFGRPGIELRKGFTTPC